MVELPGVDPGALSEARAERAAILEYEAGLSRAEADAQAARELNWRYCLGCEHDQQAGNRCRAHVARLDREGPRLCIYFMRHQSNMESE